VNISTIPYPPGVPPLDAHVYRNLNSTAGLASYTRMCSHNADLFAVLRFGRAWDEREY
jgi:hypothetical protein